MPWFKVDDNFANHPKVLATSLAARGLWVTAGAWSSAHLTDGAVPDHVLASLGGTPELAAELVAAGLWRRQKGCWRMHDWKTYNPTRKETLALRATRAEAGRLGGLASGKTRSKNEANDEAAASGVLEAKTNPRPVPTPKNGSVVTDTDRGLSTAQRKPDLAASPNGAAARQPPPYADAVHKALNPDQHWDAFRKDPP